MVSGFYKTEMGVRCFHPSTPRSPSEKDVIDLVERAADAVRRFDQSLATWKEPSVVGRLFARLDAVSSAGAEGSTTTFTDLLEYESSLKSAPDVADAASVAALVEATEEAADHSLPVTCRRLHRRLFERGSPLQASDAGEWKARPNRTMDPDSPGGMFAYAAPSSVTALLDEWQRLVMDNDGGVHEVARQCLGHWMFEHIHPFRDGNGRVGRLLVPVVLRRKGVTRATSAFVSEGVYFDKQLYVEALKGARISGDMLGWTRLMLGFMAQGAEANLGRLQRLAAIETEWRDVTGCFRSDGAIHRIVPFALTRPAFTITDATRVLGGTFASVNNAVAKLVDLGLLSEATGGRRDRLFHAPAVLDVFDWFRVPRPTEDEINGPGGP